MKKEYNDLHDLVSDEFFPKIDTQLRFGWHCDEEDIQSYDFIEKTFDLMFQFYEGYGCELVHAPEGFFYLRFLSGEMKTHTLTMGEMLVGQFLAMMRLDPRYLETSGNFSLDHLMEQMELLLGEKQMFRLLLPRRREKEVVTGTDQINLVKVIKKSLRELSRLGFVSLDTGFTELYPRKPVLRFIDPVRNLDNPTEALANLLKGESPFEETEEEINDEEIEE